MKNNKSLSAEELYGFADPEIVRYYQQKYLRFFTQSPVLDLGCGRGIFLSLLKDNKIEGVGVDESRQVIDDLKSKNYLVYHSDVLNFLQAKKNQYAGIFCSHLIEHNNPERVKKILHFAYQVLKPGGVIVIITPNPQDLRVMTEIFWLDQTHVRPYPLKLLEQMLHQENFNIVEEGVDNDTKLKHFKNPLLDHLSQKLFNRLPIGPFVNSGHDIYIVGKK